MRWERLFSDLEAQAEAAERAEIAAEAADRTRREHALLRLVDRLEPAMGGEVGLHVRGLGPLHGRLVAVGSDYLLLGEPAAGGEVLVALPAVTAVTGLLAHSRSPGSEGRVAARRGLVMALRVIARDRSPVRIVLVDAAEVEGTIDRVGADFVEVAVHAPGEPRRSGQVRAVHTLPYGGIAVVRRR